MRFRAPLLVAALVLLAACAAGPGPVGGGDGGDGGDGGEKVLYLGAIPDQDHDRLQETYGAVARYLSERLDVPVEYRPVTDYAAAVSQFRTGDLHLVWFGGLTGVQAAAQVRGAKPLVQRDIDDDFHSVFIASTASGLAPVRDLAGLRRLAGVRFTFGSQSSTSGYLMPAYYLRQAGVDPAKGFAAEPGFSGSHDKTIDLVESGSYQAGAVNEQVWTRRLTENSVDRSRVTAVWRTPAYHDYHWVLSPEAERVFGAGLAQRVTDAFLAVSRDDPQGTRLLDLFGCSAFVPTSAANYRGIEDIGRELGLVPAT